MSSLIELKENNDIWNKLLEEINKARYNRVIREFIKKWRIKTPEINTYISGRQTHSGRMFIKNKVGPLIYFPTKYYIYGFELIPRPEFYICLYHYNENRNTHTPNKLTLKLSGSNFTRLQQLCYSNGCIDELNMQDNISVIHFMMKQEDKENKIM